MICSSFGIASDNQSQDGKDLIEKAAEKVNIFALPYFEMKANVRIDNQGKPLEGTYSLLWNGLEQWREEINFPGYTEIQMGGKGVVFLKRSTDFMPLRINQLHAALGYGTSGIFNAMIPQAPRTGETIKKVKDRKVNGTKVQYAEILDQEKHSREVCVDPSTGTPVREGAFIDKDMKPVGPKLFPRFLSYVQSGKPVAEIQVTELRTRAILVLCFCASGRIVFATRLHEPQFSSSGPQSIAAIPRGRKTIPRGRDCFRICVDRGGR